MFNKIRKNLSAFEQYNRAEKWVIAEDFERAISELENFDGPPLYKAKVCLLRATIFHRVKDYSNAERIYGEFLANHLTAIRRKHDRDYLENYSRYFQSAAAKKMGWTLDHTTDAARLRKLHDEASLATRGEFPFSK